MKILILASNPRNDLKLDHEIRDLKNVIETSRNRQQFEVEDALAVRVGDLQDLLFNHRPQIVHFCGHGSGQQGLVFEGNDGAEQWVRAEALSDLFRLFSANVECVLLNACYSEEQANAIVNHINYVIGMNQEIRDDAAIAFSKGFYRALGYERSIEQAFEFGCNAIQLEISGSSKIKRSAATDEMRKIEVVDAIQRTPIPEHLKPILKMKPTLTPSVKANITSSEQSLTQETRTAIQLDIDKSLEADVDEEKSKSWWYTLPGVITSLATAITALAGLVVAIKHTDWFGPQTPQAITTPSTSTSTSTTLPSAAAPVVPAQDPPLVTFPTSPTRPTYSVGLPAMRDYRLGAATFTLLKAEVSPQTTEKDVLLIRLRMMNHDTFDANFWDRSFRLIVDGVPMAPKSDLNELVAAQSAKEGDVIFVVPRGTTGGKLKITYADGSTEIPLALGSRR